MRDLLTHPLWRAEDLGLPLPLDPHAVSVALPLWEHVVGYEENDPRVIERLQCGYPRFVVHPLVRQLSEQAVRELARNGESAWLYASLAAARRVADFAGAEARIEPWRSGLYAVLTPDRERARLGWRFFGEGISSRRAEAVLHGRESPGQAAAAAVREIRSDLARRTGQSPEDVLLFPSGMAAMGAAHRLVRALRPGRPSVQMGFPYVDVLKVQQLEPSGVSLVDICGPDAVEKFDPGSISGVFTEVVSNPQLRTPPLARLSARLAPAGVPLVADDTIATFGNVDVFPHADLMTTSLTKFYSGAGNVLAGSLVLNRSSPLYPDLRELLEREGSDDFFGEDAVVLATNARDFDVRLRQINRTSERVHAFLEEHPAVETAWYPKDSSREDYDAIRRPEGGYSGLLTLMVKNPERNAAPLYDRLRISKGPSLGTNFSLVCPYMLLAHYNELGWTDGLGIDRHLLRLSVGLEPAEVLIDRLGEALDLCQR